MKIIFYRRNIVVRNHVMHFKKTDISPIMTNRTCKRNKMWYQICIYFFLTIANLSKIKIKKKKKKGTTFRVKLVFQIISCFVLRTTLFSADPLKFDIRPRGVFIIPRQLSAIIRQGCFYRNSAKTRGAYVSKGVCVCSQVHTCRN